MSTGISIVQASYGVGTTTTDVTNTVASLVKDGSLKFTVSPATLNVTDPAPGQLKTLTLTYTINGGSNNTSTTTDSNVVSIDAPPATVASGLQITKAEYGYPGNFTDVTDSLQNQVSNGSINITVGFKSVGIPDPNPNKQKELKVEYTLNGKKTSETLKDGKNFKLSAPPAEARSNTTPSQNVGSIIGMIFKAVAYFFGMFLYTLSIFTAIEYGNQFISPMLWGALAFFIPFFSFWALPIITFWIRLFSSQDIIV
jgi:hypothetical protein